MSTAENETQTESSFEQVTQKVLHWIVERIPVANNTEKEWIRAHIDALYVDPDAVPIDPNAGQPVDQPVQTSPPPVPIVTTSGGSTVNGGSIVNSQVNNGVNEEVTTPEVATVPASYPVAGTAEDIRNWYATATDDEINQLNAARAAGVVQG